MPLRFDIRDGEQVAQAFATARPDCVIHTAALTKPDYCEIRQEETRAVNVLGTRHVACACNTLGAKLIHISTDLVFDGTKGNYSEDDPVEGINEYSRSKIAAEQIVLAESPNGVILRLSVLYGPRFSANAGFIDEMVGHWQKGEAMGLFTDQYRTPTFAPQVADAVERILAQPHIAGLFHLGGAERLSRYEFATMVANVVAAPAQLLRRSSMLDHAGPAKRPQDCSLASEKIRRALGITPVRLAEGLSELVQQGFLTALNRT